MPVESRPNSIGRADLALEVVEAISSLDDLDEIAE
jgi:hypothetical protein